MSYLQELFSQLSLPLDLKQQEQFQAYTRLLISYNEKVNLTAITEPNEIDLKHYLDSCLLLLTSYFEGAKTLIDVGCGAGFPSVPLKILRPDLQVTLMDSLNKRIAFLDLLIQELGLTGIKTIHSRAEDGGQDKNLRQRFDLCAARAVAPLNVLLEYCVPFVKKGGFFIALKGKEGENELSEAKNTAKVLGVTPIEVISRVLPGTDMERKLLIFEKTADTPKAYPRKAGKPSRQPL